MNDQYPMTNGRACWALVIRHFVFQSVTGALGFLAGRFFLAFAPGPVRGSLIGMNKIVGIDLGTTNSLVATVDSGIPLVIADQDGQRLTPSVVHVPGPDASPVVGHPANRLRVVRPAETVYSVKRFIGRRGSEISDDEKRLTFVIDA